MTRVGSSRFSVSHRGHFLDKCSGYSFLMVQTEWREFWPSATIAAVLEYHLGSWKILFALSPWKDSSILIDSGESTQFSTP